MHLFLEIGNQIVLADVLQPRAVSIFCGEESQRRWGFILTSVKPAGPTELADQEFHDGVPFPTTSQHIFP